MASYYVSTDAADLLDELCEPRPLGNPDVWSRTDVTEFDKWREFERSLKLMPLPADLDRDKQQLAFHRQVDIFHAALPFGEEERNWLIRLDDNALEPPNGYRNIADWYARQEQRIIVAGIRRVVRGRELTHRWYDWRREQGNYKGQETLPVARFALNDLVDMLTPYAVAPKAYQEVLERETQPERDAEPPEA
ncbi:MAG TPA: hypothetical protein VGP17_06510 [Solirubrobacteraceae bacterium]|nr:hypothetical protein [Solirubrobacteraceae bacterium]